MAVSKDALSTLAQQYAPEHTPQNPMALGQTLYQVLNAGVFGIPKGQKDIQFQHVSVNQEGIAVQNHLPLSVQQITQVQPVFNMQTAKRPLLVLGDDNIVLIEGEESQLNTRSWSNDHDIQAIIGDNTDVIDEAQILLAGSINSGILEIYSLSLSENDGPQKQISLQHLSGHYEAGLIIQFGTTAMLVVATKANDTLNLYAIDLAELAQSRAVALSPALAINNVADQAVSMHAASLSSDAQQQTVLAYTDTQNNAQLSIVEWTNSQSARLLATSSISQMIPTSGPMLSSISIERQQFHISSSDFKGAGYQQLILAFSAKYDEVSGCVALISLELSPSQDHITAISSYVVANQNQQPFSSISLDIAAGLFGALSTHANGGQGLLGVLAIGAGATFQQLLKGEASLLAGFIPVNPANAQFPEMGKTVQTPQYINSLLTIDANSTQVQGTASDLLGQSIVLGAPSLQQITKQGGQLLALIQAPPYEASSTVSKIAPTVTVSHETVAGKAYDVSANRTWLFSEEAGKDLGLGDLSLSESVTRSYGKGFSKTKDNQFSQSVKITHTLSQDDLAVLYTVSYSAWRYPVLRPSTSQKPNGELLVLFPNEPEITLSYLDANVSTLGYTPGHQNGKLLSYINQSPPGFQANNEIFLPVKFEVAAGNDSTVVSYNKTHATKNSVGNSFTVHNTTEGSAKYDLDTQLFDYFPISFGLDIDTTHDYNSSKVTTTSLNHTSNMTVTISSGTVTDTEYAYFVTPKIYRHDTLGCLVLAYETSLSTAGAGQGSGWAQYFKQPDPILKCVYPFTQDPILGSFTRDIKVTEAPEANGQKNVVVSIFNNALNPASAVSCSLYRGKPVLKGKSINPPQAHLATQTIKHIDAASQVQVSFSLALATSGDLTVEISTASSKHIYWAVYPPEDFSKGSPE